MASRHTMHRIAQLADVSVATVSRVYNNSEHVSPETRERVLAVIQQVDYSYNALASGLSRRQTSTLGLIVPTITNPIFAESTRGVQEVAAQHGYIVLIGNTDYRAPEEERLVDVFRQHRIAGLIVTSSDAESPALLAAQRDELPIVLTYSSRLHSPLPSVGVDNQAAATEAVNYLVELGHRRIAMLAGTFRSSDRSHARYRGYVAAHAAHRIPLDPTLLREVEYSVEHGAVGLRDFWALPDPPTALFCSNDVLAFGALRQALDQQLRVPDDLSIVGFDDSPMAPLTNPRLTTVHQPAYQMGQEACRLLLERIVGKRDTAQSVILPTELRIRETAGPPRRT